MKDTRGQSGRTIELMIPIAIIALIAAVVVPNFYQWRDRKLKSHCASYLGSQWRHDLEMYAIDHKGSYPTKLTGKMFTEPDVVLISSMNRYLNVTVSLRRYKSLAFDVVRSSYTITAVCRDRNNTIMTATPEGVTQP